MSLWNKAQQLPPDMLRQVKNTYSSEQFPIEVRHYLAAWIEDKIPIWQQIDPDNPAISAYAQQIVGQLIEEIEAKAASYDNQDDMFLTQLTLKEAASVFRNRYLHSNPLGLVAVIRQCLNAEDALVQQFENLGAIGGVQIKPEPCTEIQQQLEQLHSRTRETAEELRQLEQEQEAFALAYHECTKVSAQLQHVQLQPKTSQTQELESTLKKRKESGELQLSQKVSSLLQCRMALADKYRSTIEVISVLQQRILDEELITWKRDQQMAGNGKPFSSGKLDQIQEWCEALAEIVWHTRHQIKECERNQTKMPLSATGAVDMLPTLNQHITRLLSSLVTSTFIIEKQPPQVMKTNTRFAATVRLLVGGKLNVHMTPPQVRVSIISEAQANALLKNDQVARGDSSGDILNNVSTMEYHQGNRQLSVQFRNMQLRKIKRAEKKGSESVMDEKFSLLFQSQFSVGGGELVFQVWTLSLPVVVIVHGNQEPHAWATVSWDNAFAEQGRVPFVVPDKVPWPRVADMLDSKFRQHTGDGLNADHINFLASKAFRNNQLTDFSGMMLSWSQFCKEPLPDRNFTFWEWFFAVMKITREHLRVLWTDNSVMGFVGRRSAEDMLKATKSGTFLLRFSDSELGGVTIAWMHEDTSKALAEQRDIFMLQPFTAKDFAIRPLADRVADLTYLLYLYPNTEKDAAFGKYYTPVGEVGSAKNGYVPTGLRVEVPGFHAGGIFDSYPNTPQTYNESQFGNPASVGSQMSDSMGMQASYVAGGNNWTGADAECYDFLENFSDVDLPDISFNFDLLQQTNR